MFGGLLESGREGATSREKAGAAFQVLVDAVIAQNKTPAWSASMIRRALSRFIWATVHGIAMLGIDGLLRPEDGGAEALILFANERLREALAAPGSL